MIMYHFFNLSWIIKCLFLSITKTYLYNVDPLKPHFYIVKLGFTGVCIIFLISAQKHRLWVLGRITSASSSNEYPQSMFYGRNMKKKMSEFYRKTFSFWWLISIYLNRRVFVLGIWSL